jgi:hypothetical protein
VGRFCFTPFFVGSATVFDSEGERTPYAKDKDDDYVFPSFRLKGEKPLSASIMVQKYMRPAAVKAGTTSGILWLLRE